MYLKRLSSIALTLVIVSVSIADEEIKLDQKVTGKVSADALKTVAPQDGIITETIAWRKLWAAWRPKQPLVDVDFQTQLVLVETVDGPNNMFANQLTLSNQGDLKFEVASTRMAGPGFAYLIMIVPKSGIQSVNGKPVPQLINPRPPEETPSVAESVHVEIVGRVRTGVVSVGAETTGAMIAADGIVMELDFQNDEQLMEAAKHLGNAMANVKGRLNRDSGVEVSDRWIVTVESLTPAERTGNRQKKQIDDLPQVTISRPQRNPPPELNVPAFKKSFKSITVVTTGGLIGTNQKQIVDSDGQVSLEIDDQIAGNWELDAVTMSQLHRFVTNTNWRTVPRLTRTANVADVFNYTITIETPGGMTRIFIDSPAVDKQPVIKQLLTYLRRPKPQPRR